MKARVVIADDHPITITGTVAILRGDDALDVVGEATDGAGTLTPCRELRPDLLLLDVRLPDMSGIAVARAVRALPDPPRVLMLSAYPDGATVRAALEAGAAGYVLKSVVGPALLTAIRRVLEGEQVLLSVDGSPQDTRAPLSPQELAVLSLVAEGLTSRAIAARISTPDHTLSARTVETYLSRLYKKMGVGNRAEAVARAQREGLLTPEQVGEAGKED